MTHPLIGINRRLGGIAYGGDYNPEQWPPQIWREDVRLMREAGVNLVTLGVFSWSRLQPRPDVYDWGLTDTVLDLLHEHGVAVDLATPTAAPP
ncbi:beta-galactosidase, partial [Streptomyces alkaliphilus]|uniref:beta-galactosidase n=1 Tax=Streptomyces alkaliphilus TaxID=1472722 RepID=UPI00119473EE|nr:beta-galactosidase [Streptomyces alkaliphilus]